MNVKSINCKLVGYDTIIPLPCSQLNYWIKINKICTVQTHNKQRIEYTRRDNIFIVLHFIFVFIGKNDEGFVKLSSRYTYIIYYLFKNFDYYMN